MGNDGTSSSKSGASGVSVQVMLQFLQNHAKLAKQWTTYFETSF